MTTAIIGTMIAVLALGIYIGYEWGVHWSKSCYQPVVNILVKKMKEHDIPMVDVVKDLVDDAAQKLKCEL